MSVNHERELTTTETAIIDSFGERIGDFPGDSSVMSLRDNIIEQFKRVGLPSRKQEYWHYTDLRTLLRDIPQYSDEGDGLSQDPLVVKSPVFAIFNGKTLKAPRVDSVKSENFADLLATEHGDLQNNIADDDFIAQLNTAFVTDGWFLELENDAKPEIPIELQTIQPGGRGHVYSKISVGNNCVATFIDRQIGGEQPVLASSANVLNIGENSEVTWVIIRDRGIDATQFSKFEAKLEKAAKLYLYVINIGSSLNRQEINVDMAGEGADFQLRVINLLAGQTHSDVTMCVRHLQENTTSSELIRNVVTDNARGAFQGMIRVAKEAQKTDAKMTCNSLILSNEAEFDSKPELEIFADDVACGHGSTVSEIDRDQLFYLMARGIPEVTARGLLVKAFVSELVEDDNIAAIQDTLESVIDKWLENHL